MHYFLCAFDDESIQEAEIELGEKGAFQVLRTVRSAIALEVNKLDEKLVSRLAGVKMDRAKRLLPFAEKFLKTTLNLYKKYPKSDTNLSEIYQKSDRNLSDFYASNDVYAENRPTEENRIDKKENIYENDFSVWYEQYPNKKDKASALKAYIKARKTIDAKTLLDGLATYKQKKESWKAWKMPATWLNAESWNDEYPEHGNVIGIQAGIPQLNQLDSYKRLSPKQKWEELFKYERASDVKWISGNRYMQMDQIKFNGECYCFEGVALNPDFLYPDFETRKQEVANA